MRPFLLYIFLTFISHSALSQREELFGVWEVYQVDHIESKEVEKQRVKYLRFMMDGSLQAGNPGKSPTKFGSWYYHEESKTLTITSDPPNKDDGNYSVVKLKRTRMVLENELVRVYLDRGPKL